MKCYWCGEKISEDNTCSEECRGKLTKYKERVEKNKIKFSLFLLGYFIIYMILLLVEESRGFPYIAFSWLFGILGFILVIFPFATPQTIKLIGVRKSVILIRVMGICFMIIGACFIIMLIFK